MIRKLSGLSMCTALLASACAKDQRTAGGEVTDKSSATGSEALALSTIGSDTVTVLTTGDGVWGPVHDAVEVFRVPGTRKETTFGLARGVTVKPDGGVLVFDEKGSDGAVLRSFDSTGKFERNIGRMGSGPGEYSREVYRIAVAPNGVIVVRDQQGRISRFAPDGRFLSAFTVQGHGAARAEIVPLSDGSVIASVPILVGSKVPIGREPMVHFDSVGTVLDTIVPKPWLVLGPTDDPFPDVRQWWIATMDGRMVVSRTDRLAFLLLDPKGGRPLVGEVPSTPVPRPAEAIEELKNAEAQGVFIEDGKRIGPPPKEVAAADQPAGTMKLDGLNRIWITKVLPRSKGERHCSVVQSDHGDNSRCVAYASYSPQLSYIAFDFTGAFLGEVKFPRGTNPAFHGDYAWALVKNENDEPILVKYRVR